MTSCWAQKPKNNDVNAWVADYKREKIVPIMKK